MFSIKKQHFKINEFQSDDYFKYFFSHKENGIVKPLCIILPQMNGYIKYLESGGKNMSFVVKNDDVSDIYNEIWDKIKNTLNITFHSMLLYDEKYKKAKVREFNGVIKTDFLGDEITKENMHYTCIASITIDSVMNMEKKALSTGLFIRVQIQNEEDKED